VATCLGIGYYHLRRGAVDQGVPLLERGVALCTDWELPLWFSSIAGALGHGYLLAGRLDEALATLSQAVHYAVSRGVFVYHALTLAYQAEAHLLAGRVEPAHALARESLELARRQGERSHEVWALRMVAETAGHDTARAEVAVETYGQALALADRLGMRPMVARCRLGLGLLAARLGRRDLARAGVGAAASELRVLGMTRWLDEADTALRGISAPSR
jgi:tetratricopeptide (TPR) repeat protein